MAALFGLNALPNATRRYLPYKHFRSRLISQPHAMPPSNEKQRQDETAPFLTANVSTDGWSDSAARCIEQGGPRRWWSKAAMGLGLLIGVALTSLVWTLAILLTSRTHPHSSTLALANTTHTPSDCGSDYATAIANGCKFQLWSYTWVPPACFDEQLHDEYLALRDFEDWKYYLDGSDPPAAVPLNTVLAGNRSDLHSTWGQHYWHCAFYHRRFLRMVDGEYGVRSPPSWQWTQRELGLHHAKHCQRWLSNPFIYKWDAIRINLTVGYDTCG